MHNQADNKAASELGKQSNHSMHPTAVLPGWVCFIQYLHCLKTGGQYTTSSFTSKYTTVACMGDLSEEPSLLGEQVR